MMAEKQLPGFNMLAFFLASLLISLCLHSSFLQASHGVGDQILQVESSNVVDGDRHCPYIVYVLKPENIEFASPEERTDWYRSFLPSPTLDSGKPRLIYSYQEVISGFAALLTPEEVIEMESKEGFIFAQAAKVHANVELRTTHSPHFLRLDVHGITANSRSLWDLTDMGENMTIGIIDSGIDPKVSSFQGMPNRPKAWKNKPCQLENFKCNGKVVGARVYDWRGVKQFADDETGHGTMVASCAAGNSVPYASLNDLAIGTAYGAAPRAQIAIYRCDEGSETDILGAFDDAILDRVHVISLSLGLTHARPFHSDPFAIGSLRATLNGTFVSVAAGNNGPDYGTILETAPWTLSVGASTVDRELEVVIQLGDGTQVKGESLFSPIDAARNFTNNLALVDCRTNANVKDKVIFCEADTDFDKNMKALYRFIKDQGAAGVVLMNQEKAYYTSQSYNYVGNTLYLNHAEGPTIHVSYEEAQKLKLYFDAATYSGAVPVATFYFLGTKLGAYPHPEVASFSTRGPSLLNNGVLKPDIIGPGHNILVAGTSKFLHPFVMSSGTSLACPHLSGVAALIKKLHPSWTPAAIRSAIMTTASIYTGATGNRHILDHTGREADGFTMGAGHVNPVEAIDPGLVYDIDPNDYIRYICGLRYSNWENKKILGPHVDCNKVGAISGEKLNYPSFNVKFSNGAGWRKVLSRTLRNVANGNAMYKVGFSNIPGVRISVSPQILNFGSVGDHASFSVMFELASGTTQGPYAHGHLWWSEVGGHHTVRSTIMVQF